MHELTAEEYVKGHLDLVLWPTGQENQMGQMKEQILSEYPWMGYLQTESEFVAYTRHRKAFTNGEGLWREYGFDTEGMERDKGLIQRGGGRILLALEFYDDEEKDEYTLGLDADAILPKKREGTVAAKKVNHNRRLASVMRDLHTYKFPEDGHMLGNLKKNYPEIYSELVRENPWIAEFKNRSDYERFVKAGESYLKNKGRNDTNEKTRIYVLKSIMPGTGRYQLLCGLFPQQRKFLDHIKQQYLLGRVV